MYVIQPVMFKCGDSNFTCLCVVCGFSVFFAARADVFPAVLDDVAVSCVPCFGCGASALSLCSDVLGDSFCADAD